jgi:hypothetical protein
MPRSGADKLRRTILAEHRDGVLLGKLFGEYAYRSDETHAATVEALISLHNEGKVDLVRLLDAGIPQGQGSDFFLGMSLYCELIPRLHAPTIKLMSAVRQLVAAGGQDLAANEPHRAFRTWCQQSKARVDEVISLAGDGSDDAQSLLSFAFEAGAELERDRYVDAAIDVVQKGHGERQLAAVVALSRIAFSDGEERAQRAADALEKAAQVRTEQHFQLNVLRAAFELAEKAPSTLGNALTVLDRLDGSDPHVVHACAQLLGFNGDGMDVRMVDALLARAARVEPANKGTVDRLDFGLRQLWMRGEYERVTHVLEHILSKHDDTLSIDQFDNLTHAMLTSDRRALENTVVRWFLDGQFRLCDAISSMISKPTNQFEFTIDFERFSIADEAWPYLARKAVGFFILSPTTAASFIVCLLRRAPHAQCDRLKDLLFDPILINYYGAARDYCERVASNADDVASPAVADALARQRQYLSDLQSVGEIRELHPSERQRRAEWRRQSDTMNAAYKAASKRSIFSMLAQRRELLYGNRSIGYSRGPNDEMHRTEIELKSISTSIEVPRVEIVDPVGLQYQLALYRSERLQ